MVKSATVASIHRIAAKRPSRKPSFRCEVSSEIRLPVSASYRKLEQKNGKSRQGRGMVCLYPTGTSRIIWSCKSCQIVKVRRGVRVSKVTRRAQQRRQRNVVKLFVGDAAFGPLVARSPHSEKDPKVSHSIKSQSPSGALVALISFQPRLDLSLK